MIKNKTAKSENFSASNTKTFQKEKAQKAKLSRMCRVCTVLLQNSIHHIPLYKWKHIICVHRRVVQTKTRPHQINSSNVGW